LSDVPVADARLEEAISGEGLRAVDRTDDAARFDWSSRTEPSRPLSIGGGGRLATATLTGVEFERRGWQHQL